jgi:hypothetical protein
MTIKKEALKQEPSEEQMERLFRAWKRTDSGFCAVGGGDSEERLIACAGEATSARPARAGAQHPATPTIPEPGHSHCLAAALLVRQ